MKVVEFSLLGACHAIPKSEVEDVIGALPWRRIPGQVPEIMAGVALYEGTLLPVLDLAMVFGHRSPAAAGWRMVLIRNGDFRALVITETVFGDRSLPLSVQRTVPILLPHNLVYGCYPDGNTVKLILNVQAIAVHFEKSLIRELMPAFSNDVKQGEEIAPVPHALEPEVFETPAPSPVPPAVPEPVTATVVQEEIPVNGSRETGQEEPELEEAVEAEGMPAEIMPDKAEASAPLQAVDSSPAGIDVSADDRTYAGEGSAQPVPETAAMTGSADITMDDAEKKIPVQASSPYSQQETPDEQTVEILQDASSGSAGFEPAALTDEKPAPEPEQAPETEERMSPGQWGEKEPAAVPAAPLRQERPNDQVAGKWRRYAAVAALLLAVVYGIISRDRTAEQQIHESAQTLKETGAAKAEPAAAESIAPPLQSPRPSLVLEIPAHKPVHLDEYIVVEGDTLWSVSERFTGNPFNYPRIAGENRIANPDLIYPGQKIRLQKK